MFFCAAKCSARHARRLDVVVDADLPPLLDVYERVVVARELELADAEHGPRRAGLRLEPRRLREAARRLGEVVAVVEDGREVPPAFGPLRPERERSAVLVHGLVEPDDYAEAARGFAQ